MDFKSYDSISDSINNQINHVCDVWKNSLGDSLVGVYIHGSLALSCFMEKTSDLDILIVTKKRLSRELRLKVASEIMLFDNKPCPLEMSAIWINDLSEYPVKCQFHYSDYWTASYEKVLSGELESNHLLDNDFEDSDIASYIRVLNQSGICVYGESIDKVFPKISDENFWESISSDIDDYDFNAYNPRYFVSNILILGRILSYKVEKRVLSKYEGALWMIGYLPVKYHYIIKNAINVWFLEEALIQYNEDDLEYLKKLLIYEIKK